MKAILFVLLLFIILGFQNCSKTELSILKTNHNHENKSSLSDNKAVKISAAAPAILPFQSCYDRHNEWSTLTWCSSYELMAYLSLYRSTRDLIYISYFLTHAENVMKMRDDFRGFANRTPTWSQTNYTNGIPYPTLVGDGMITYPFIDFAYLILKYDPHLSEVQLVDSNETLKSVAERYLSRVKETVAFHDKEWSETGAYKALPETATYFLDDSTPQRPISNAPELPLNMSLAMGRTLILLWLTTEEINYRDKVKSLIDNFLRKLVYRSDGTVYWPYWSWDSLPEDVSHGAIDVDFLRLAHNAGFSEVKINHLQAISNTFNSVMYIGNGQVTLYVTGGSSNTDLRNSMSWVHLSTYIENIKYIGIDASRIINLEELKVGYGAWVSSLLKEFGGRKAIDTACSLDSECLSNLCLPTSSIFTCSSKLEIGKDCRFNKDCKSGLCNKASSRTEIINLSDQVPWKLNIGKCTI